jgi:hypothetical protein
MGRGGDFRNVKQGRKTLESLDLVSPNTMRLMLMTGVAAAMFRRPSNPNSYTALQGHEICSPI